MKVETDLAPRDHAFVLYERLDLLFRTIVVEFCVVRMCADSGVDVFVSSSKLNRTFQGATVRIARADINNCQNPRVMCSLENFFPISVKLRPIQVRVRINKHSVPLSYFKRAPFGTSSVNVAITGRPSSPYDAATTIPCDSNPRSLRGFRFATMT